MKKKLIQAQIPEELHDILRDISFYDRKPVAQLLREILDTLTPGLRDARDMMKAAHDMTEDARKKLMPELLRHGQQVESNVKYGLENMAKVLNDSDKKDSDE